MTEQSIKSDDMTLKRMLQDFYSVPDYQREYVWGEVDQKGERGDEVEQFLQDIYQEFEEATDVSAPEYFIGTTVVCQTKDGVFELIDGQQRSTTIFLTLCALRDRFAELGEELPRDLPDQIAASSTDWQGRTTHRLRLDLQYEDSGGVLKAYANADREPTRPEGTRSIANMASAYEAIREFLVTQFRDDPEALRRFYGYFTNKVKLIRIQTPTIAKALKIFETINDRGVGLDAMDLLKNLLFMHAPSEEFSKLKDTWKGITDTIYGANEKPLRFLRYFVLANYKCDPKIAEDAIYDWFSKKDAERQTRHVSEPLAFACNLFTAAKAYANFMTGLNPDGTTELGIVNTRYLGGRATRQHFILLLAGSHLERNLFTRLAREIENLMFVWLVTSTPTKEYERAIIEGANRLRAVSKLSDFERFVKEFFEAEKRKLSRRFYNAMLNLQATDMRVFRIRYLLAKLTQHIDIQAFSSTEATNTLAQYIEAKNDIEHILPERPTTEVLDEFGEAEIPSDLIQRLGNLMLVERSLNRALGRKPYSQKVTVYPNSQFLLVRCQAGTPKIGVNDRITKVARTVPVYGIWNRENLQDRQRYLTQLAHLVWEVPSAEEIQTAAAQ